MRDTDNETFTFSINRTYHTLALSEILYFSSSGRKITIFTTDGQKEFYGSLDKISHEIQSSRFLYVHKSFLVNYRYIRSYRCDSVTMTDGAEINISQSRRQDVRKRFIAIKAGEM